MYHRIAFRDPASGVNLVIFSGLPDNCMKWMHHAIVCLNVESINYSLVEDYDPEYITLTQEQIKLNGKFISNCNHCTCN